MIKVIFEVNVAYPNEFSKEFDLQRDARSAAGKLSSEICGKCKIPNTLLVNSSWDSEEAAESFWNSGAARLHVASWGSVKQPSLEYFRCL